MKIGCCIGIEYYDAVAAAGYDAICLPGTQIRAWTDEEFSAAKMKIRAGRLHIDSCNTFCSPELRLTGRDMDLQAVRAYTEFLCTRALQLGIRYIGIGAPKSRSYRATESPKTALLDLEQSIRVICETAQEHHMLVLLESVCSVECNLLTTMEQAFAFIKKLHLSNLHLVYDIYHEYMEKQSPEIVKQLAEDILVAHIAHDKNNGQRYYLKRGQADPYRAYCEALKACKYNGTMYVEAFYGYSDTALQETYQIINDYCN